MQTVHVNLPLEVANDLERFQVVQKGILERLGCLACCSGFDIRFNAIREFVVDEKLNINPRF